MSCKASVGVVALPLFSEGRSSVSGHSTGKALIRVKSSCSSCVLDLTCTHAQTHTSTPLWRMTDDSSAHEDRNRARTRVPGESTPSSSPRHAVISGTSFQSGGNSGSVLDLLRIASPLTSELCLMSPVKRVNETGRLSSANLSSGDSNMAAGQQSSQKQCQALSVCACDSPAANISLT